MKRYLLCAALAAVVAGCTSTSTDDTSDPAWRDAEGAYLAGDWPGAISAYDRFLGTHAGDQRVPTANLRIGRAYLAQNRPANALPFFDRALAADPDDAMKADVHAARGMAQHFLGNAARAEAEFMDAVRIGGQQVRRDECLYYVGVSKIRQGRWDDGLGDLGVVIRENPDSPYAAKARALRAATDRSFAVQAGAFSDPAGARRRSEELKSRGFTAEIVAEAGLNCVRLGKYATWREAADHAKEVEAAAGIETTVVP